MYSVRAPQANRAPAAAAIAAGAVNYRKNIKTWELKTKHNVHKKIKASNK